MKKLFLSLLVLLLIIPSTALAFEMRAGKQIFITKTINEDAYMAGGIVQVDADINGDLFIGGGKITITGDISQDLTIGGGDIYVGGEVGDDVRIGGGNVRIDGIIKGDLFIGGGNVDLADGAFVGGDLVIGAGTLNLNGDVQGSIVAGLGTLIINSRVGGNVLIYNADRIVFGPDGQIVGNLSYRAIQEQEFESNQVLGAIDFELMKGYAFQEQLPGFLGRLIAGFTIYRLLSLLFFGLFLLWIYRYFLLHTVEHAYESPLRDLGVGVIILLLTPILGAVFMFTIIGIPIAVVLFFTWLVLLYLGAIVAAAMIGGKIVRINEKSSFLRIYGSFAIGVLILVFLGLIPIIGWVLKALLILIAIGAIASYHRELSQTLRKKKLA